MDSVTEVLSAQILVDRFHKSVQDRLEAEWIEVCDDAIEQNNGLGILGYLNHLIKNDLPSFRWAMFQLCIRRGYEELVANFFIGTYQLEHDKQLPRG